MIFSLSCENFTSSSLLRFQLFDIITISSVISTIISSVTKPAQAMFLVLYVFICAGPKYSTESTFFVK